MIKGKEIKNVSGIYKIINLVNGKFYLGSSNNCHQRWMEHLSDLRRNCHHSIHFQRAWNKYGEENFIHEIIEAVENIELIIEIEQYWLDNLQPYLKDKGYNICSIAGKTTGFKHSEETKQLLSEKGKGLKRSNETKQRISEGLKGINTWTKGAKQSEEHIKKRFENLIGVPRPQEVKDKISKKALMFSKDNEFIKEYFPISSAKQDGFDTSAIVKCCKGKLKHYKGFIWKYGDENIA